MKWELKTPSKGDMIRVKLGSIYHYGVFVSEEEVVQFGLAPNARPLIKDSEVEVCVSDIDVFLQNGFLEVATLDKKERKKRQAVDKTVQIARSRIGEKGYNILYNNCEHFAYECVFGEKKCTQADTVREFFRNLPIVDVYVAKIPSEMGLDRVYPSEREEEIARCGNDRVKREKYYAWKLLAYALNRTFGYKMENLRFEKSKSGKWRTPSCFFSISHSEDAVTVVVSRSEVGIDIEWMDSAKDSTLRKALTRKEAKECEDIPTDAQTEYLLKAWTGKESIFKTWDKDDFQPSKIHVADYSVESRAVAVAEKRYMLSVATEFKPNIRWYFDVQI